MLKLLYIVHFIPGILSLMRFYLDRNLNSLQNGSETNPFNDFKEAFLGISRLKGIENNFSIVLMNDKLNYTLNEIYTLANVSVSIE